VFDECPYKRGYDLKIGAANKIWDSANLGLAKYDKFRHGLVFFGGLEGIEGIIEGDESIGMRANDLTSLFDFYLDDPLIE
jgi:hypothetical protein